MELAEVRHLMDSGRIAEAYDQALLAAGMGAVPPGDRANLLLLGAQGAARLGRHTWAAECLVQVRELAQGDPSLLRKALAMTGKAALRAGDWTAAEESFLAFLAEAPPTDPYRPFVTFGLAQVYEGRRSWQTAAATYLHAAELFGADNPADQMACYQTAAWCFVVDGELSQAEHTLLMAERFLKHAPPKHRQIQSALEGYWEYQIGNEPEAFAKVVLALDIQEEPSSWATCLAAVTSGMLAWSRQDEPAVRASLQLAESLIWDAVIESGPCYLRDLVHDLRCKVLLRWGQV
jgi:tetratricopeptide (TPR) repeat protein